MTISDLARSRRGAQANEIPRGIAWLACLREGCPPTGSRLEDAVGKGELMDPRRARRAPRSRRCFAGRRHDYHFISQWSPDDALWDLSRLFFDVARLEEVRLC
jgi:hypothetical protein